jgi:hypothetical protein
MALHDSKTRCVLKKSTDIISMIVYRSFSSLKAAMQYYARFSKRLKYFAALFNFQLSTYFYTNFSFKWMILCDQILNVRCKQPRSSESYSLYFFLVNYL